MRQGYLAALLLVTLRTLADWRRAALDPPKPPGRPPIPRRERWRILKLVARERRRQGPRATKRSVWRALAEELGGHRDLVHHYACALWRRTCGRQRQHIEDQRVHVEVHLRGAIFAGDGTELGRDHDGQPIMAEHIRDVATSEAVEASVGPPLTGTDVVRALERASAAAGAPPLVFMSDNGPENKNAEVQAWLERNQVIHLKNRPHTPEHNASCERGHRDLKAALATGPEAGDPVLPLEAWTARVDAAKTYLNAALPRERLGGLTPRDYAASIEPWYARVDRARFYAAACQAILDAQLATAEQRARARLEREAILATLELFGVISRTRGDARRRARKWETVSRPQHRQYASSSLLVPPHPRSVSALARLFRRAVRLS